MVAKRGSTVFSCMLFVYTPITRKRLSAKSVREKETVYFCTEKLKSMIQNEKKRLMYKQKKIKQCLSGERLRKDHIVSCFEKLARSPSQQFLTSYNDITNA